MSMKCRQVRKILAEEVVADLDAAMRTNIETHFASCAACARRFREALAFDAGLTAALHEISLPAQVTNRRGIRLGEGPKWILLSTGFAGSLTLGYFAGEGRLSLPWPATKAHAETKRFEHDEVVSFDTGVPGFEQGGIRTWGFEEGQLRDWTFPEGLPNGNHISVDSSQWRTGSRSLRLSHTPGGGRAHLDLTLPIPRGTRVVFSAWFCSPNGRVPNGKWLSLGASLHSSRPQSTSVEVVAPNREWQQVALNLSPEYDANGLTIEIHTTAGDGTTPNRDWFSWVDDVQVSVILAPPQSKVVIEGDKIIVDFQMPNGYPAPSILKNTLAFLDKSYKRINPVSCESMRISGNWVRLVFQSKEAVAVLKGKNPDTKTDPSDGLVRGRIRIGNLEVPIEIGVRVSNN